MERPTVPKRLAGRRRARVLDCRIDFCSGSIVTRTGMRVCIRHVFFIGRSERARIIGAHSVRLISSFDFSGINLAECDRGEERCFGRVEHGRLLLQPGTRHLKS